MANTSKTITILTFAFFTSIHVGAESLRCKETNSFREASLFINRDGAVGFNGTYIELNASWFSGTNFENLGQLTNRSSDIKFQPTELSLYLSPKGSCTLNNDSLSQDFACSVTQGEIDVVGSDDRSIKDGSIVKSERISKRLRLKVNVNITAKIQVVNPTKRSIQMTAVITNTIARKKIKLKENMECEVE